MNANEFLIKLQKQCEYHIKCDHCWFWTSGQCVFRNLIGELDLKQIEQVETNKGFNIKNFYMSFYQQQKGE